MLHHHLEADEPDVVEEQLPPLADLAVFADYDLGGAPAVLPKTGKKRKAAGDLEDGDIASAEGIEPAPVEKPKVHKTNLEKVIAAIGEGAYDDMISAGYKILWANAQNAWRGFRGSTYIIGSSANLNRYGTDEVAIVMCYDSFKKVLLND